MKQLLLCVVPGMLAVLLLLSRRGRTDTGRTGILGLFDRAAAYLLGLRLPFSKPRAGSGSEGARRIEGVLEKLYPGGDPQREALRYRTEKLSRTLLILGAGSVLALLTSVASRETAVDRGMILRPEPGQQGEEVLLSARLSGGRQEDLSVLVEERMFGPEEAEAALPAFAQALGEALLKDNPGPDAVTGPLEPVQELDGYPFTAEWMPDPSGLVNVYDGSVAEPKMRTAVLLTAKIRYRDSEWEQTYPLTILPPDLTPEESLRRELLELTDAAQEQTLAESYLELPREVEGEEIRWAIRKEDQSGLLFGVTLLAAALIHVFSDRDLEQKLEERRRQMKEDYPAVLRKLSLYVGAGMTLRSAFEKIAAEGAADRAVYEEMQLACRGMRTGTAESEAYERFGKRCGLQEYVRFTTLLAQNLRKGSSDLLPRLREETAQAGREKLLRARKHAEEAVTKLLVPMVLMLLVVMGMIMIPAFSGVIG